MRKGIYSIVKKKDLFQKLHSAVKYKASQKPCKLLIAPPSTITLRSETFSRQVSCVNLHLFVLSAGGIIDMAVTLRRIYYLSATSFILNILGMGPRISSSRI